MYGSEKVHNTYFIVQGTSFVWQREGTQHVRHCPRDVICIAAKRHTTRTSFYRDVICMAARRHTTHTSLSRARHMYGSEKVHTSLSRGRYMYGSEKVHNTYVIVQGTSYV